MKRGCVVTGIVVLWMVLAWRVMPVGDALAVLVGILISVALVRLLVSRDVRRNP